jgi:hypothetical protein
MSFFKRFLGKVAAPAAKPIEQCLIVHFEYGLPNLDGLYEQAERPHRGFGQGRRW